MSHTESLRRSYDQMASTLQQKEQFTHRSVPWTPRIKGIDALLSAHFGERTAPVYGAEALARMYGLSDAAIAQLAQTYRLLLNNGQSLQQKRDMVATKAFGENRAPLSLGRNQLGNRQLVAWEFQEAGMATLGRKAVHGNQQKVAALPTVLIPQIIPVPDTLVLGVAGILEPKTSLVYVRDDLNPAKQEFRPENWDLYAGIMATHFRAAYGGHLAGISNKSHLATALGFSNEASTSALNNVVDAKRTARSLHTGHEVPNEFLAAISGSAIWTHMSIIELPVTTDGPAIVTALNPQTGEISRQIDTAGDYTFMIQAHHIDPAARQSGRLDLKTPQTLQIGDMDPLTAMMYASLVQQRQTSAMDGLRRTIHHLGE